MLTIIGREEGDVCFAANLSVRNEPWGVYTSPEDFILKCIQPVVLVGGHGWEKSGRSVKDD